MHYRPDTSVAFNRVFSISRELEGGWVIRFVHVGGASAYFVFMYLHISRGL